MLLSGLFTTRGPTSRYFLGRREVHTCGGSITWSSTDTILGIVGIEVSFSGGRDDLIQVRPRAAVRRPWESAALSYTTCGPALPSGPGARGGELVSRPRGREVLSASRHRAPTRAVS